MGNILLVCLLALGMELLLEIGDSQVECELSGWFTVLFWLIEIISYLQNLEFWFTVVVCIDSLIDWLIGRVVSWLIVWSNHVNHVMFSTIVSVEIYVEDVDENLSAPRFKDFVTSASVLENQPADTFVSQVKATDEDGDGIVYSLVGGSGLHLFRMDNEGELPTLLLLCSRV